MRIDAETASATIVDSVIADAAANERALEANNALREGIKAAQAGEREKARTALLRAADLDSRSEAAWLWLASISEYPEELVVFLNNVLDINPNNARANEWMAATKALLAKTFVQRGIDAMDGSQKELAAQCFAQALEHDQKNTTAWLWLANLSDSNEGKLSYLEKVLEIDPENETARAAHDRAKNEINQALLAEARAAAVAGRKAEAHDLLGAFIAENPDAEDGWILRAHLADGFAEKIAAFEKVVEINPENPVARSGLDSLRAIMQMVAAAPAAVEGETPEASDNMENTAYAIEQERALESEVVEDRSPTQELEFPEAAAEMAASEPEMDASGEDPQDILDAVREQPVFEEMTAAEPSANDHSDWSTDTVAFSFIGEPVEEAEAEPIVESGETFELVASPEPVEEFNEPASAMTVFDDPVEYKPDPEPELLDAAVLEDFGDTLVYEEIPQVAAVEAQPYASETEVIETEPSIPMPEYFDAAADEQPTGYETVGVHEEPAAAEAPVVFEEAAAEEALVAEVAENTVACAYCNGENPPKAFQCGNCLAALSLSDIEMMLANTHADADLVRRAVENLEAKREYGPLDEAELAVLGIGYLNLRDFQLGHETLAEAVRLNPDDVVLAGQVNALHVRLEEMKDREAANAAMPKGKSILVVDDSATVRKLIAGKLEKSGHDVYCAADGVEALKQLEKVVPDLILLDITMPRMDGYQVCKVIRSKETIRDVPVVMISGKDGFFDKVRGRMAGTTGYITKPFGPETLMKAVENYLRGEHVQ